MCSFVQYSKIILYIKQKRCMCAIHFRLAVDKINSNTFNKILTNVYY